VSAYEAEEAHARFLEKYQQIPTAAQHQAAHLFGEALYAKDGIESFSVCDGNFGFGCFHSFISFAIDEHGESVATELDKKCIETYGPQGLGCLHGIGHGLLAHFGYDEHSLSAALELCGALTWKNEYGGCQEGVFMEYDFRTMADAGNQVREYNIENPISPCNVVAERFRVACYFSVPSLWAAGASASIEDMSTWCTSVRSPEERAACFRGIGNGIAAPVNFSPEIMRARCDTIADEGRVWCREGAAWMLYADPKTRNESHPMCTEGLSAEDAEQCVREYLFVIS